LEPWDTPELLRPRLEKLLAAMPVRWVDQQTAQDLTAGLALEVERMFAKPRVERGGLE
jgi:hypothetical protein